MNSTFTGNMMNVKEQYKLMSSGVSSTAGQKPQNVMMDAIVQAKKIEDQKAQIENRIIKLRKEEERAAKRIRDLQKQQKFRDDCNKEKERRINYMMQHKARLHETEENNRQKFNQDRIQSQSRIQNSMERTFYSNRLAYNDVKTQQVRINELVQSNNV